MDQRMRVGELAAATGVSVRTLHHYDHIGLLRPSARNGGGQRLYTGVDLVRLQHILTLRYLGLSLKQIRELLSRQEFDLVAALRAQRSAVRTQIESLERVEQDLGAVLDAYARDRRWDWSLALRAAASTHHELEQHGAFPMSSHFTPEQLAQFAELNTQTPATDREAIEQAWTTLLQEVRAGYDLDPASAEAQALGARWQDLTERTAAAWSCKPELWQAVGQAYKAGAYEGESRAPQAADFAFIERVKAAKP